MSKQILKTGSKRLQGLDEAAPRWGYWYTQEIAEKIETVAPAREEARDSRIEILYARTRKYAISDYNQKEEWWEGYFFFFF